MKDIQYYENKYKGLLIKESTNPKGFKFSCSGPYGYWAYTDDLSFFENNLEIVNQLNNYKRTLELLKIYPYLYISPHGIWLRSLDLKRDGIGTDFVVKRNIEGKFFSIYNIPHHEVSELNEESKKYHENPIDLFFCSKCCRTYEKTKNNKKILVAGLINIGGDNYYGGAVDCAVYCNKCVESNNNIKEYIEKWGNLSLK